MKTLNLVYSDNSDVKYEISRFPDGQQQVKVTNFLQHNLTKSKIANEAIADPVLIKSRLNNFTDLELIICTVKSLRKLRVKEIHLYTPYFLGSRSDRQFEEGSNNYLKDVICPIINSLKFESVTVLDPHSNCLEMGLNNFKPLDNRELVKFALSRIYEPNTKDNFVLVSPDAGASHKIYKAAELQYFRGDIITCSKERDKDGKLTKTIIPSLPSIELERDLIIIDDICDGGATFINIAKMIKLRGQLGKIYLIITHGIFSKGFKELSQYFDGIYCTNSYSDVTPPINFTDIHDYIKNKVKQLNVF